MVLDKYLSVCLTHVMNELYSVMTSSVALQGRRFHTGV